MRRFFGTMLSSLAGLLGRGPSLLPGEVAGPTPAPEPVIDKKSGAYAPKGSTGASSRKFYRRTGFKRVDQSLRGKNHAWLGWDVKWKAPKPDKTRQLERKKLFVSAMSRVNDKNRVEFEELRKREARQYFVLSRKERRNLARAYACRWWSEMRMAKAA